MQELISWNMFLANLPLSKSFAWMSIDRYIFKPPLIIRSASRLMLHERICCRAYSVGYVFQENMYHVAGTRLCLSVVKGCIVIVKQVIGHSFCMCADPVFSEDYNLAKIYLFIYPFSTNIIYLLILPIRFTGGSSLYQHEFCVRMGLSWTGC